ncbi:MAG: hypothetical protein OXN19_16120 [Caldilineaceae bacterium]|nr:hypothetical protein [Caldilineaceae bacterium]
MERHIEERFERNENVLEKVVQVSKETAQINKDTARLAGENQQRLNSLLADSEKDREEWRRARNEMREFIDEVRRERRANRAYAP